MCFEGRKKVNITDVWRKRVPELVSRVKKGSVSHGAEADNGHIEVDRRESMEGAGMGGDVQEIAQIRRDEVVDGLECVEEDFN